MTGPFKLYPEARHWWSFNDYGAVLSVMERLQPKRCLEFGPGSSTLALIEGGASHIDTCEDDPVWAATYEERLQQKFLGTVFLHRYTWAEPLTIPSIDDQRYDLALVDGPLGTNRRPTVVRYCLDRCKAVLVPTEDANKAYRPMLEAMAGERSLQLEIMETGPLSGGFALFVWPDQFPPAEDEPFAGLPTEHQGFAGLPEQHQGFAGDPTTSKPRRRRGKGRP